MVEWAGFCSRVQWMTLSYFGSRSHLNHNAVWFYTPYKWSLYEYIYSAAFSPCLWIVASQQKIFQDPQDTSNFVGGAVLEKEIVASQVDVCILASF